MTKRHAMPALAAGVAVVLLSIWQHCDEAQLARRETKLRDAVERTRREVEFARVRLEEAQARSAASVEAVDAMGLTRPAVDQVILVTVPKTAAPAARPADGSVAVVGRRFLDALLPTAGARVAKPDGE